MRRLPIALLLTALLAAACSDSSGTTETTSPVTSAVAPTPATNATTTTTLAPTTSSTAQGTLTAVPDGIGDSYYPELGNTGYDVEHYLLDLVFDPDSLTLTGLASITAAATSDLDTFNLDFIGFEIQELTVDGAPADFARSAEELTIRPQTPIPNGEDFDVAVLYSGTPGPLESAAISFGVGWNTSPSGQHYVVAEPDAARSWFPANDHPRDKATFTFRVTVPDPLVAAANGTLVERETDLGQATWVWEMPDPMAPYLATVVIGPYEIVEDTASTQLSGIRVRNVLPADLVAEPPPDLALQGEMIVFFEELFGPYPFDTYGIAVVDDFPAALENQTLSVFGRALLFDLVLVHELAHQWFGDHVSPAQWEDIWLNEGFASYAEWLWIERQEGPAFLSVAIGDERQRFAEGFDTSGLRPPGEPPPDDLFSASVYRIGAMTLHALRLEIGNDAFFETLRTYVARFGGGTATTEDFIAVAEEVSGVDLDELFDAWLHGDTIPEFPL
jgi:aminopeptidase N